MSLIFLPMYRQCHMIILGLNTNLYLVEVHYSGQCRLHLIREIHYLICDRNHVFIFHTYVEQHCEIMGHMYNLAEI